MKKLLFLISIIFTAGILFSFFVQKIQAATIILRPNNNSATAGLNTFPNQSPVSGFHWDKVEESTADETYIYTNLILVGANDLFQLTDVPSPSGTINSVTLYIVCRTTGSSAADVIPKFNIGGNTGTGTGLMCFSTSWVTKSFSFINNPITGLAWTWSDINNLEAGLYGYIFTGAGQFQITQVYVVVDYTPTLTYSLSVSADFTGTGSGNMNFNPPNTTFFLPYSTSYNSGTSVTLTAIPNAGSTFVSWGGDCSGVSPTCTISMTAAKTVTAKFNLNPVTSPTVTTDVATVDIVNNTATLRGTVTNTGGATVDQIKFMWSNTSGGPYTNTACSSSGNFTGAFSCDFSLPGIVPGNTNIFYYKAQAYNSAGWSDLAVTNERRVVIYLRAGGPGQFTTLPAANLPPNKPNTTPNEAWDNCSSQELSTPIFNWTYSDPDGDPYESYEIWIDDESSFSGAKFNNLVNTPSLSYSLVLAHDDNSDWISQLVWGTTYYWKVKVKDNQGNWSVFSDFNPFTTPAHAYPWVSFTAPSLNQPLNIIVKFTDGSKCYPGAYDCSTGGASISYSWNFGIGSSPATSAKKGDATTTYTTTGVKDITLTITDSSVGACDMTHQVTVGIALPKWWEVPPILWIRKSFAVLRQSVENSLFAIAQLR